MGGNEKGNDAVKRWERFMWATKIFVGVGRLHPIVYPHSMN